MNRIYDFVFRGLLTEEALDRVGRTHANVQASLDAETAVRISLDVLDEDLVAATRSMAVVYSAIAAFENSARKLINDVLVDRFQADWWEKGVSQNVRKKAEGRRDEEERIKWHGQRGVSLLHYTDLGDLANVIRNNWEAFVPYMPSAEWASAIFSVIERSRNVIMHSGVLVDEDVQRVGINIRDWVKQVGT